MIPLLVATWYAGAYVGQPLYCGGIYDESTEPWVALPIQDETWECGDLIFLRFENGDTLMARALDAGPFGDNCVMQVDGSCAPIAVDVPHHLWPADGLSASVCMTNITARLRAGQGASVVGSSLHVPIPPIGADASRLALNKRW